MSTHYLLALQMIRDVIEEPRVSAREQVARIDRIASDALRDAGAAPDLLVALRSAAEMLAHIRNGGSYSAREYLDREHAIGVAIANAGVQS